MIKKNIKSLQFMLASIYIWIGFVGAISFMEAWLKFQAEGVTRAIGLSIGKLVFAGLNKVEIVLAIFFVIMIVRLKNNNYSIKPFKIMSAPFVILLIQTVYLLPILEERAILIINNQPLPDSKIHILYVVFEIIKMISLFWTGNILIKNINNHIKY